MLSDEVVPGRTYRITGSSPYFQGKYGTSNPAITIRGPDIETVGPWKEAGCFAAFIFHNRVQSEDLLVVPGSVFYGQITVDDRIGMSLGELVTADELEEIS